MTFIPQKIIIEEQYSHLKFVGLHSLHIAFFFIKRCYLFYNSASLQTLFVKSNLEELEEKLKLEVGLKLEVKLKLEVRLELEVKLELEIGLVLGFESEKVTPYLIFYKNNIHVNRKLIINTS